MESGFDQITDSAPETKYLEIGCGAVARSPTVFARLFPACQALVVADPTTYAVAGRRVLEALSGLAHSPTQSFIFTDPRFYAEHNFVTALEEKLRSDPRMIPIAVGAGTINDVSKLAAHRMGRRYMCVATAASMDGYTAFGASITHNGAKQTFACGAPLAVVADLDVIGAAPSELSASGYADLLAKVTAGADWILADALEVERIHPRAWDLIQGNLARAIADPAGIRVRGGEALRKLTEGLMMSGFAMQFASSSRPASGAEHQFSHLWDMQHHTHQGVSLLHGFKVGIGTLASAALYEFLLAQPLDKLEPNLCLEVWPDQATRRSTIRVLFGDSPLAEVALKESQAKYVELASLGRQLARLREIWPDLRTRLCQQLLPFGDLKRRLQAAGAPTEPEQIGLSRESLRESFRQAYFIRRRFTVLDLAVHTGLLEKALDKMFGAAGAWSAWTGAGTQSMSD